MEDAAGAFARGVLLNAGLIAAIGAQNAFVLAQGLARRFVFIVALVSSFCDSLLVAAGTGFTGAAALSGHWAAKILLAAGILFLFWFGGRAALAAARGGVLAASGIAPKTARGAIAAALALGLLNPHAALEMLVIFGGVAAQQPAGLQWYFAAGGIAASFAWFFGLGFGAAKLAPLLARPAAWRVINGVVALMMFGVAFSLLPAALK
ncbi:MAG: LysE/ArgO family amino acid transporter [Gammaproteobacteria bacterium]